MNRKALVLLSGGLDSILTVKVLQEQDVEVEAVNFIIEFAACMRTEGGNAAQRAASGLKVPLKTFDITDEYLEVLKHPKHGYGANINPCIDCKIFMLRKAREYMERCGASFLATGEVLGERPMSQRRDALNIIEKEAGVRGILLRPLSAKLLTPTAPETEGVVDRERLLDIKGRSRKPQMALAEKFGIREYPNPAGGCLLTDPGFTKRVKDLIKYDELNVENLKLAMTGRHFRLSGSTKLVVGRDARENAILDGIAKPNDILFKLADRQGPLSILKGAFDKDLIYMAARIVVHHTKFRDEAAIKVNRWVKGKTDVETMTVAAASPAEVEALRI